MNNKETKYQDYTNFTPEKLKFLDEDQEKLADDHLIIIRNLRKKEMTAKEIHDFYYEEEKKTHSKSLKTIYRYLKDLDDEGIVTITGHRIKEGSRVTEKLYGRTAQLFIRQYAQSGMCEDENKEYADMLTKINCARFGVVNPDFAAFKQFYFDFFKHLTEEYQEVFTSLLKNEKIPEYFAKNDINKGNYILDLTATFGTLVRHPELLEQLANLIS